MKIYLVLKVPETVKVSAPDSLVPAAVDATGKLPVNFRVPVAPAYFPVPPVISTFPEIATVVGAADSLAQPCADGSKVPLRVLVPSEMVPTPFIPSHWLAGDDVPLPVSWVRPSVVPVPVAVIDVVLTLESVQSMAIFPVYVALRVNDFALFDVVAFAAAGLVVVQPAGHLGVAALMIFEAVPL